jgi:hypothetical protein
VLRCLTPQLQGQPNTLRVYRQSEQRGKISFDILYELTCVLHGLFRRSAWRGKPEAEISNDLEMTGMERKQYAE